MQVKSSNNISIKLEDKLAPLIIPWWPRDTISSTRKAVKSSWTLRTDEILSIYGPPHIKILLLKLNSGSLYIDSPPSNFEIAKLNHACFSSVSHQIFFQACNALCNKKQNKQMKKSKHLYKTIVIPLSFHIFQIYMGKPFWIIPSILITLLYKLFYWKICVLLFLT